MAEVISISGISSDSELLNLFQKSFIETFENDKVDEFVYPFELLKKIDFDRLLTIIGAMFKWLMKTQENDRHSYFHHQWQIVCDSMRRNLHPYLTDMLIEKIPSKIHSKISKNDNFVFSTLLMLRHIPVENHLVWWIFLYPILRVQMVENLRYRYAFCAMASSESFDSFWECFERESLLNGVEIIAESYQCAKMLPRDLKKFCSFHYSKNKHPNIRYNICKDYQDIVDDLIDDVDASFNFLNCIESKLFNTGLISRQDLYKTIRILIKRMIDKSISQSVSTNIVNRLSLDNLDVFLNELLLKNVSFFEKFIQNDKILDKLSKLDVSLRVFLLATILMSKNETTFFSNHPLHKTLRSILFQNRVTIYQTLPINVFLNVYELFDLYTTNSMKQKLIKIMFSTRNNTIPLVCVDMLLRKVSPPWYSSQFDLLVSDILENHVELANENDIGRILDKSDPDVFLNAEYLKIYIKYTIKMRRSNKNLQDLLNSGVFSFSFLKECYSMCTEKQKSCFENEKELTTRGLCVYYHIDSCNNNGQELDITNVSFDYEKVYKDAEPHKWWSLCLRCRGNEKQFEYVSLLLLNASKDKKTIQMTLSRLFKENPNSAVRFLLDQPHFIEFASKDCFSQIDRQMQELLVEKIPQILHVIIDQQLKDLDRHGNLNSHVVFWDKNFQQLDSNYRSEIIDKCSNYALKMPDHSTMTNILTLNFYQEVASEIKTWQELERVSKYYSKSDTEKLYSDFVRKDENIVWLDGKQFSQLLDRLPESTEFNSTLLKSLVEANRAQSVYLLLKHDSEQTIDVECFDKASNNKLKSEQDCVVCLSESKCMASKSCGHISLCENCSQLDIHSCPICRKQTEGFIRVYF